VDPVTTELVSTVFLPANANDQPSPPATLMTKHPLPPLIRRADRERISHPEVGLVDLLCEVLVGGGGGDQFLIVLFARPGTDAREKLDLLHVIGTQDLTVTDALRGPAEDSPLWCRQRHVSHVSCARKRRVRLYESL
jgi:hypothetical protein